MPRAVATAVAVIAVAVIAVVLAGGPASSARQQSTPRLVVATTLLAASPPFADEFARGVDEAATKLGIEIVPVALDFADPQEDWVDAVEAALAGSPESMLVTSVVDPLDAFGRFVSQRAADDATVVLVGSSVRVITQIGAATGVLSQDPVAALHAELDRLGSERVACLGQAGNFPVCGNDILWDRLVVDGTVFDDSAAERFRGVAFDTLVVEAGPEPGLDLLEEIGRDDVTVVALWDDGAPLPDNVRAASSQPYVLGFMSVVSAHLNNDVGVAVPPQTGVVADLIFRGKPGAASPDEPLVLPVSVPTEPGEPVGRCGGDADVSLLDMTALADADGDGQVDRLAARRDGTLLIELADRTIVAPLPGEPALLDVDGDGVRELWLGNELYEIAGCAVEQIVGTAFSDLMGIGAGLPPVVGCRGDQLVIDALGAHALLTISPDELTLDPIDDAGSPCPVEPVFAAG